MTGPVEIQLTLPYFSNDLPEPLPTEEDIENPDEVLTEGGGRRTVRVGDSYAVK